MSAQFGECATLKVFTDSAVLSEAVLQELHL